MSGRAHSSSGSSAAHELSLARSRTSAAASISPAGQPAARPPSERSGSEARPKRPSASTAPSVAESTMPPSAE
eukprot:scaffold212097_cov30-Tisochrysis_lutea.AAC.2